MYASNGWQHNQPMHEVKRGECRSFLTAEVICSGVAKMYLSQPRQRHAADVSEDVQGERDGNTTDV
jgi:hypothetical protein